MGGVTAFSWIPFLQRSETMFRVDSCLLNELRRWDVNQTKQHIYYKNQIDRQCFAKLVNYIFFWLKLNANEVTQSTNKPPKPINNNNNNKEQLFSYIQPSAGLALLSLQKLNGQQSSLSQYTVRFKTRKWDSRIPQGRPAPSAEQLPLSQMFDLIRQEE